MEHGVGRRGFLAALAWAAAACRPREGSHAPGPAVAPPDPMREALAACERILGVEYTDTERAQLLRTLDEQLQLVAARGVAPLPNALPPATRFDPRPPGFVPPAGGALRWGPPPSQAQGTADELAFASIRQLQAAMAGGAITSRRLTQTYLERLETHGVALQAVVTPLADAAMAQAERADAERVAGGMRSPLHGIPWVAKDLFDTAGVPTTWGAAPFRDRMPAEDATVVARLDAAGAVLLAKVSTGALAFGDVWFGGTTRNPWNPREGSSGSSAGPAACVAAGLAAFGVGTETLGSIVSPAMRCGTVGLRPTFGRVPRTGTMSLCWTLDKIGPLTRTAEDALQVLSVLTGPDGQDLAALDVPLVYDADAALPETRVGTVPSWWDDVSDAERAALTAARGLGGSFVELDGPADLPYATMYVILLAEAAAAFETLTRTGRDDELTRQDDAAWPNLFRRARLLSAIDFVQADRIRRQAMLAFDELFADVDVLIGPSFADSMLLATNMTGHPCVVVRAGFAERSAADPLPWPEALGPAPPEGPASVPVGVTLWGRLFDEGRLTRVASALEAALGVATLQPARFS